MTGTPEASLSHALPRLLLPRAVLERVLFRLLIVGQVRRPILLRKLGRACPRRLLRLTALHFVRAELFLSIEVAAACIAAELVCSRSGWRWHHSFDRWRATPFRLPAVAPPLRSPSFTAEHREERMNVAIQPHNPLESVSLTPHL